MAKTSAFAVVNFLLDCARDDHKALTHLRLQKLLFFCYAWYAGNKGEELFSQDIEAWQFGPVVRDVYLEFKDCGSGYINHRATEFVWTDQDRIQFVEPNIEDESLKSDIKSVWDQYKDKSVAWLVEATHSDDEPWGVLVSQIGAADKRQIPFDLIKRIYAKKVQEIAA